MFGFFKNALRGVMISSSVERNLQTPDDLQIGDIITFRFLPQATLSNKNFQVSAINTTDFKQGSSTIFTLKGESSQPFYLALCNHQGEKLLSIRQKINRKTVDQLFGLEAFSVVFEEGEYPELVLMQTPENLKKWVAEGYYKTIDCRKGYCHAGDYRNRPLPSFEDESTGFDYYRLLDKTENFGVEVEVYGDGESEVYITLYHPLSIIESMWPGK